MAADADRRVHDAITFLDIRAQAIAAAVLQICAELRDAQLLDEPALERIKEAIAREVAISRPKRGFQAEFSETKQRLDALFAGKASLDRQVMPPGAD